MAEIIPSGPEGLPGADQELVRLIRKIARRVVRSCDGLAAYFVAVEREHETDTILYDTPITLAFFETPLELQGGAKDGERRWKGIDWCVSSAMRAFPERPHLHFFWHDGLDVPVVRMVGKFEHREVTVELLAWPPDAVPICFKKLPDGTVLDPNGEVVEPDDEEDSAYQGNEEQD